MIALAPFVDPISALLVVVSTALGGSMGWASAVVSLAVRVALLPLTLRVAYRIESLERESHRLAQIERQLRLEAAYLASPERLAERAHDELGFAEPAVEQVIFVEELGR